MSTPSACARLLVGEGLGTALLLTVIVGSGIMGERLADGNTAIALLANALATGAGLLALILTFSPISGSHFNPLVTLVAAWHGGFSWRLVPGYILVQCVGAILGVLLAHALFDLPLIQVATHARHGAGQWLSEVVATFGLIGVIMSCSRRTPPAIPLAVAAYITAAYWFTASTAFANPAVTIARSLTNTFAGIVAADVGGFIAMQVCGALAGAVFFAWLIPVSASQSSIPTA